MKAPLFQLFLELFQHLVEGFESSLRGYHVPHNRYPNWVVPPPEFSTKASQLLPKTSQQLSNELLLNLGNQLNASPQTGCNYLLLADARSHI